MPRTFRERGDFRDLAVRPFGVVRRPHRVAEIRTLCLGRFRKFWVRTYGPQAGYWRERLKELGGHRGSWRGETPLAKPCSIRRGHTEGAQRGRLVMSSLTLAGLLVVALVFIGVFVAMAGRKK